MSNQELCRELIALSRQGGSSLKEIRDAKKAAAAKAKEEAANAKDKGGKGKGNSEMARSQSVPTLGQSVRSGMGTRRGGGWAHQSGMHDLAKYKEKLDDALTRGVDIDFCEKPFFRTALWEATWKNHEAIVRVLAAKGAKVATADFQGRTPLHEAAFYGHVGLLEFLIDKGHPVDCADTFGQTPLFRAVEAGRHEVARLLVEHGAQTNQLDADRVTVQHVAAFNGLPALSHFLVNRGAVKNRLGMEVPAPASVAAKPTSTGLAAASRGGARKSLKAGATLMFGDVTRPRVTRSTSSLLTG